MRITKARYRAIFDDPRTLGVVLIAPAMLAILAIVLLPLLSSLWLSLQQRDLPRPQNDAFIWFKNYWDLLHDPRYLNSLNATFRFSLVSTILELVLGVAIALVLNQKFFGRGFVRGLMILPWAMPSIVNAAMWKWIYNADYGALNALLTQLHLIDNYRIWLAEPVTATVLVILANVWKETPFTIILVLAALQTIPDDLYEASRVDGATEWYSFLKITLPMILPVLMIAGMLQFIWGFQTFELIYVITGGGPFSTTELTTLRIYAMTFRSLRFGYGAAMAYLTSLVILIPAVAYIRSAYKRVVEI
ncbi:MAG: sugar ABC transporter permease [Anaerolineales bacterium]|nr:sugar ABC transporter permease [Anaerolineales bacterium]